MNREIKFRVWDIDGEQMITESGYIQIAGDGRCIAFDENNGEWLDNSLILEQYAGCKDVNGVEIYEGDIIKHGESTRIIEVHDSRWCAVRPSRTESILLSFSTNPTVIGNIHQHPELLTP